MSRATPRQPANDMPATHWSLVDRAGGGHHQALAELLGHYLEPLRGHLLRRWALRPTDADDVLQAFVADRVLTHDLLPAADHTRGRFRTFLLTALDNFALNHFRAQRAQKRTPTGGLAGEDLLDATPDPATMPPDAAFDVAWAREVIAQAVAEMRAHCTAKGQAGVWGVFEARVLQATLGGGEPVPYAELVERFGFASPTQASNVLVTGTRMFQRFLRAVVGRYEREGRSVDEELADLRGILAAAGAGRM